MKTVKDKTEIAMVGLAFLALAAAPTVAPAELQKEGYGAGTTQAFVGECVKTSSERNRPFCECMMNELQKAMSYEEFRAMDRDYASGKPSEANRSRMDAVAKTCVASPKE